MITHHPKLFSGSSTAGWLDHCKFAPYGYVLHAKMMALGCSLLFAKVTHCVANLAKLLAMLFASDVVSIIANVDIIHTSYSPIAKVLFVYHTRSTLKPTEHLNFLTT